MGRRRKTDLDLPQRVYRKHGSLHYVDEETGEWKCLGRETDFEQCMITLAQLRVGKKLDIKAATVNDLLNLYFARVVPNKAPRTQRDNLKEAAYLRTFFGEMLVTSVTPQDVATYRDTRTAKVRGNREIALLSHAFTRAVEWGIEGLTHNPCAVVSRNREKPRDRYVDDAELNAFKKFCPDWMRTYLEIKRMSGLRKQTMLELKVATSIVTKTKKRKTYKVFRTYMPKNDMTVDFRLSEDLQRVIDSIPTSQVYFFETREGKRYTEGGFDSIWKRRMAQYVEAGGTHFVEHDIRGKFATDYEDSGRNPQHALGHKKRSTTDAYIKSKRIVEVDPL